MRIKILDEVEGFIAREGEKRKAVVACSPNYDLLGYVLAMRVLQSELYAKLSDAERAQCDELIRQGMGR